MRSFGCGVDGGQVGQIAGEGAQVVRIFRNVVVLMQVANCINLWCFMVGFRVVSANLYCNPLDCVGSCR